MPDLVAERIAEDILSQRIKPGTTLPPERELTEAYGVSRGTLREALRILESYGLITVRTGPGGGPVVQPVQIAGLIRTLSLVLRLAGTPLAEVVEARQAVEPLTASFAAMRATDDEIAELEQFVQAMDEAVGEQEEFLESNQRFHEAVARMSRNSALAAFAGTSSSIIDGHGAGVQYTPARLRAVNASHRRLFEAIRDHDPDRARTEADAHLQEFQAYIEKKYPQLLRGRVRWMLGDEGKRGLR
jgi:DNA-binding FadR family transcriptional regulator